MSKDDNSRRSQTRSPGQPEGLKKGLRVGKWVLAEQLNRGGNGEVWAAADGKEKVAIKFLLKLRDVAYTRFKDEVKILSRVRGIEGILPILDSDLPEVFDRRPWYAMPVAVPLVDASEGWTTSAKVTAIAEAAETLADLHDQKIAHRDIKPGNLLIYQKRCHVADFGLVDYPEKADLTGPKEQLGPRWTMAPEVFRQGRRADPFPADVYALAKTMWILLVNDPKSFDGQYNPASDLSIRKDCGDLYITPLENLLVACTQRSPERRPTMRTFAESLREWIRLSDSFPEQNPLQWVELQRRLFPITLPTRVIWEDLDEIVVVLNLLGETSNLNHLLFPDSGGLDLERATRSTREPGCIELTTNNIATIIRPARLLFEAFGYDPEWNYFRLEAADLEPSGVYQLEADTLYEELTDIGGESYVDRSYWDQNEYDEHPLPEESRAVMRFFRGAFVIFQKTSLYNQLSETYDARHNKMSADEFREYIRKGAEHARSKSLPRRRLK